MLDNDSANFLISIRLILPALVKGKEFTNFTSFKTHNLDVLLQLSGKEKNVKSNHLADWSIIAQWEPEVRYKSTVSAKKSDAQHMISSSKNILGILGIKV